MKIAICISGYLRTFEYCWDSVLEKVIQDNDYDVFIHTYNKKGYSKSWENDILLDEDIDFQYVNNIKNLKKLQIDYYSNIFNCLDNLNVLQMKMSHDILRVLSMFYKIYQCNELKKQYEKLNNFKYDLVVRLRGDIFFKNKIDLNKINDNILVNNLVWENADPNMLNKINDQFAIGSSEQMDIYSYVYNEISYICRGVEHCPPEFIIYSHLLNNNISIIKQNDLFNIKRNNK